MKIQYSIDKEIKACNITSAKETIRCFKNDPWLTENKITLAVSRLVSQKGANVCRTLDCEITVFDENCVVHTVSEILYEDHSRGFARIFHDFNLGENDPKPIVEMYSMK